MYAAAIPRRFVICGKRSHALFARPRRKNISFFSVVKKSFRKILCFSAGGISLIKTLDIIGRLCYNYYIMKAYRIHSPHMIKLDEMNALPVGDNCVKLKNLMCGISSSDIAVFTGRLSAQYPIVPVRQNVGFVSEVGANVSRLSRGNRVVTAPHSSCHGCKSCNDARFYDCEKPVQFGLGEDGFLSDFSVVSVDDVYAIPDRIKDEEAVFIEHIALAINTLNRLNVEKGEHIVIVGATLVGIILAQVAMYYQAVPIVVDMREDMLAIAQRSGVYFTINAVSEDVCKKILSITGGHMADECAYLVTSKMPLQNVCDYTAMRGRAALVGRLKEKELNCNLNGFFDKRIDLYTVADCGRYYSAAINMLANHTVSVDMLYDKIVPFSEVPAVFESLAAEPDSSLKVLVKI